MTSMSPEITIDRPSVLDASDFLELLSMDAVEVTGRFGRLYLSETAVGVCWRDAPNQWAMLEGEASEIGNCTELSAEELLAYVESEQNILAGNFVLVVLPDRDLDEITIVYSQLGGKQVHMLHCSEPVLEMLERIKRARTDVN